MKKERPVDQQAVEKENGWLKRLAFAGKLVTASLVALTLLDNYQLAQVVAAGVPALEQGTMADAEFAEAVRKATVELTVANPLPP